MNPYSTVFSDDNYYLLAYNDKYKTIMHYRVDRILNIVKSCVLQSKKKRIAKFFLLSFYSS